MKFKCQNPLSTLLKSINILVSNLTLKQSTMTKKRKMSCKFMSTQRINIVKNKTINKKKHQSKMVFIWILIKNNINSWRMFLHRSLSTKKCKTKETKMKNLTMSHHYNPLLNSKYLVKNKISILLSYNAWKNIPVRASTSWGWASIKEP
jgi:hypothetical protein